MGHVPITDVKAGMVLANDLFSRQGRLLLPEGTAIEDRHLRIFKIWGINGIDVAGPSATPEDQHDLSPIDIDPQVFCRCDEYLTAHFLQAGLEEECMQEVYRAALLQSVKNSAQSNQPPSCTWPARLEPGAPQYRPRPKRKIRIEELLQGTTPLATFPDIYFRICEVLNAPRSSVDDVALVVGNDPALTARLLQLVNSPLYGFPGRIDSITRAVALLGADELCTLVLGISAIESFEGLDPELYDMRAFWEHATACAVLSRNLAGQKAGLSVERFFVSGLLHDIGLLALLLLEPETEGAAMAYAVENKLPLQDVEREMLGFDHGMVGGALLAKWHFPESLANAVRWHHSPQNGQPMLEPAIIHVADIMATAFSLCEGNCAIIPAMQHKAWRSLELPPAAIGLAMEPAWLQVDALRSIVLRRTA